MNTTPHEVVEAKSVSKTSVIILQFLTYAFWEWVALTVSILFATALANMIASADTSGFSPYGIAAIVVVLPIALVCDFFYSKHETEKKTGAATVVSVLHSVVLALVTVGLLTGVVFSFIQLLTADGSTKSAQVAIYSLIVSTLLFGSVLVRVLAPRKLARLNLVHSVFTITFATIAIVLAVAGPLQYKNDTKNDRLITGQIDQITAGISTSASQNRKLPSSLSDISVSKDAQKLINLNLLQYTPNTKEPQSNNSYDTYGSANYSSKTLFYTLCATYKRANSPDSSVQDSGYSSYVNAFAHPEGKVCYKISTDSSY
jgi:hypothetical protein